MKSLGMALALVFVSTTAMATGKNLKSREHTTARGSIKLSMLERWNPSDEPKLKSSGRVVVLVHGATWSSKCTFDPTPDYSLMDALANAGWDVWAVDLHGYGSSSKSADDWTEASGGAADLETALDYIRALRWVEKVHVVGFQWGAQVAGLIAQQKPHKVASLTLIGMRYKLYDQGVKPDTATRTNSYSAASLKPEDGEITQEFSKRRAEVCMLHDPLSPSGALLDLQRPSPVDPQRLRMPTLLLGGERDGDEKQKEDRWAFYRALGTEAASFISVPNLGKYAIFENGRARFIAALLGFLNAVQ